MRLSITFLLFVFLVTAPSVSRAAGDLSVKASDGGSIEDVTQDVLHQSSAERNDDLRNQMGAMKAANREKAALRQAHQAQKQDEAAAKEKLKGSYNDRLKPKHDDDRLKSKHENDRLKPKYENDRLKPKHENDRLKPKHENDRLKPKHGNDRLKPKHKNDRLKPKHQGLGATADKNDDADEIISNPKKP